MSTLNPMTLWRWIRISEICPLFSGGLYGRPKTPSIKGPKHVMDSYNIPVCSRLILEEKFLTYGGWDWIPLYPIGSMYGIFTYIWLIFMVNVGKYTMHGSYGFVFMSNWFINSLMASTPKKRIPKEQWFKETNDFKNQVLKETSQSSRGTLVLVYR